LQVELERLTSKASKSLADIEHLKDVKARQQALEELATSLSREKLGKVMLVRMTAEPAVHAKKVATDTGLIVDTQRLVIIHIMGLELLTGTVLHSMGLLKQEYDGLAQKHDVLAQQLDELLRDKRDRERRVLIGQLGFDLETKILITLGGTLAATSIHPRTQRILWKQNYTTLKTAYEGQPTKLTPAERSTFETILERLYGNRDPANNCRTLEADIQGMKDGRLLDSHPTLTRNLLLPVVANDAFHSVILDFVPYRRKKVSGPSRAPIVTTISAAKYAPHCKIRIGP
jgi:hypothetical protein